MTSFAERRAKMVDRQLRRRGISDERVLEAMGEVPRELFVPEGIRRRAYRDEALPIGHGQTISQPWIVAATLQGLGLRGDERVLEVGGGSGYTAALLVRLAAHVVSVELVAELTTEARRALILARADLDRIELVVGDGSAGHPDGAPYDAIADWYVQIRLTKKPELAGYYGVSLQEAATLVAESMKQSAAA